MTDSLLPSNATALMRALEAAFNARVDGINVPAIRRAKSITNAPSGFLAHLGYEESADLWNEAWSDAQKRAWASVQWSIHRRKGTVGAIEDAVEALGYGARLREWFDTGSAAYTFRLDIDLLSRPTWRVSDYIEMTEACLATKPVRADLSEIRGFHRVTMPEPRVALGHSATVTFDLDLVD